MLKINNFYETFCSITGICFFTSKSILFGLKFHTDIR